MSNEEIMAVLDQAEYELMDGIGMPYHARTFTLEEYETIKGVIAYVRTSFDYEWKKQFVPNPEWEMAKGDDV